MISPTPTIQEIKTVIIGLEEIVNSLIKHQLELENRVTNLEK
jgi:hypothetical protein